MLAGVVAAGFFRFTPDPDAIAIFDAMDTEPNEARKERINTAVEALKDDGIWTKLDRLWVMAAHEQGVTSRLDWKSPATAGRRLTEVNSPTFNANQGYTGNASNMYLNTNYDPSTDGVNWTQNSAQLSVWVRTVASSNSYYGGAHDGVLTFVERPASGAWQIRGPNTGNVITSGTTTGSSATGLLTANRSGSAALQLYRNGVEESTGTHASTGVTGGNIYALAANGFGDPLQPSNGQVSIICAGASLDAAEQANLYTAINAYMTGLADDYS